MTFKLLPIVVASVILAVLLVSGCANSTFYRANTQSKNTMPGNYRQGFYEDPLNYYYDEFQLMYNN